MATFSIDNDRGTTDVQDLTYDQTAGVQSPPEGDEVDVTLASGELDGLDSGFEAFLAGLALSTAQKDFAVLTDAASSSADFISVAADGGETFNDLKLVADSSTALTTIQTLGGDSIYVHVDPSGNYATLWTSSDDSGRIVGAIALVSEAIDNLTEHTAEAGVQMVFFEAIAETDTTDNDERISLSDVLDVAVDSAVSFNFDQLESGNFLWAAVGDGDSAMLITGQDLNVIDSGGKLGDIVKGGSDPSDSVNTSQASDTTIGINAQHFAATNSGDGATGLFTFVNGLAPLELATPAYTGGNVNQIDYDGYLNISSATIFISQLTGGSSAKIHFSLLEAGGGDGGVADHAPGDLTPEEQYGAGLNAYIGNQNTDSNLRDDTQVDVASVEIDGFTWNYDDASNGTMQGGITVTISGNDVTVIGVTAGDAIKLTAVNDPGSSVDGTFNRIGVQALFGSASFDIGHVDLTQGGLTSADLGTHLFADDDGPSIDPSDDAAQPNDLQVDNDLTDVGDSTDGSFYLVDPGTDGLKSFAIVGPEDDSGDFQWTYDNATGTAITGTYKGADLYTLVLNPDGTYDFTMIGELPGSTLDLSPAEVIKAGSPDNPILEIGAAQNDDFVRMTADSTVGNGNINESHGFVGCDNGNLDTGESLTFTLHHDGGAQFSFSSISIGTKAPASSYHIVANLEGGGIYEADLSLGKNGAIIVDPPGDDMITSVVITKTGGASTKIGIGDIHVTIAPSDVQLGFDVALTDGDDDPVNASFVVDIDANNDGNYDAAVNALSVISPESTEFSAFASLFDQDQMLRHDNYDLI